MDFLIITKKEKVLKRWRLANNKRGTGKGKERE